VYYKSINTTCGANEMHFITLITHNLSMPENYRVRTILRFSYLNSNVFPAVNIIVWKIDWSISYLFIHFQVSSCHLSRWDSSSLGSPVESTTARTKVISYELWLLALCMINAFNFKVSIIYYANYNYINFIKAIWRKKHVNR